MQVKAVASEVRVSPKKAKEVSALLSGRSVEDALVILEHTPRRAAKYIAKVVQSARANATNNYALNESDLKIAAVEVNNGGSYKRWRPAARGRALPYKHRLSHIVVTVEGQTGKATAKSADKSDKSALKTTVRTKGRGGKKESNGSEN